MKHFPIRTFRTDDLAVIKQLTIDAFAGVTLEQNVEDSLGVLHGHDWRWRKARHVDEDVAVQAAASPLRAAFVTPGEAQPEKDNL